MCSDWKRCIYIHSLETSQLLNLLPSSKVLKCIEICFVTHEEKLIFFSFQTLRCYPKDVFCYPMLILQVLGALVQQLEAPHPHPLAGVLYPLPATSVVIPREDSQAK